MEHDESVLYQDPLIPDCYPGRHICPHCGEQLTTVPCTSSCPYYGDCEDCQKHESAGTFWCTTLKEASEASTPVTITAEDGNGSGAECSPSAPKENEEAKTVKRVVTPTVNVSISARRAWKDGKAEVISTISIEAEGFYPIHDGDDVDEGTVWIDFDTIEDAEDFVKLVSKRLKEIREVNKEAD